MHTIPTYVAESAWRSICAELDRVAPAEAVLVPLCAVEYLSSEPWRTRTLADVRRVVITHALTLPAALQRNQRFCVAALPDADDALNALSAPLLRLHPRLRACAFLHSHPFAHGATWPSATDLVGHMIPLNDKNRAAALDTSFSFIACVAAAGWRLQAFALSAAGQPVELGAVEVVADASPFVRKALSKRASGAVLRNWRRRARGLGYRVASRSLFDGWTRVVARPTDRAAPSLVLFTHLGDERPLAFWLDANGATQRCDFAGALPELAATTGAPPCLR